ncbi:hypothetical protein [uncultured Shewanella sp.]|uniref:hypothetical protein n=1 Tax=uncultured Shewanella sp. TaxID=173975 RepID=UPI002613C6D0|nr:hypothetical protein [uncultured Shewanella sp.]
MQSIESIAKSCLWMSDVSCYEVVKDFSGPVIAAMVAFFSVRFAFKQIAIQHVNTLDVQIEGQKRQTRIELFKEVGGLMEQSKSIIFDINSYCMGKKYSNIEMKSEIDHLEYLELMRKFGQALMLVICKIESHEIVNLMLFRVFRFSLQSIHHDLLAIQFLENRSYVLERLIQLTDDSQLYFGDFQVCLQNMAYGDVFKSEVPKREPADKRCKVITNDPENLEELHHYFWRETDWGKTCIKYEEEANVQFSSE